VLNLFSVIHVKRDGIYRVSIKSFPTYKHLSQENYVEYKRTHVEVY